MHTCALSSIAHWWRGVSPSSLWEFGFAPSFRSRSTEICRHLGIQWTIYHSFSLSTRIFHNKRTFQDNSHLKRGLILPSAASARPVASSRATSGQNRSLCLRGRGGGRLRSRSSFIRSWIRRRSLEINDWIENTILVIIWRKNSWKIV